MSRAAGEGRQVISERRREEDNGGPGWNERERKAIVRDRLEERAARRDRLYAPFLLPGPVFVQVPQSYTTLAEYFKGPDLLPTRADLFFVVIPQINLPRCSYLSR